MIADDVLTLAPLRPAEPRRFDPRHPPRDDDGTLMNVWTPALR